MKRSPQMMLLLPMHRRIFVLLIFLFMMMSPIEAGSDTHHPHQGKVTPFKPGDPNIKLDAKALSILSDGKPFQTKIQSGISGRGLVVQDVKAPTTVVWDRILDYNNYAKMVPKTLESQNYKVVKHGNKPDISPQTIYTRMKVGFPMVKLQFFVKHEYNPQLNSLTWTLDYTKKSDFDDSCGYWYIVPHPDNPNWTRVYYSVEVSMFDWVPKFVVQFMSNKALTDATGWVKKFSELEHKKQGDGDGDVASIATSLHVDAATHTARKKRGRWFASNDEKSSSTTTTKADADDEICSTDESSIESSSVASATAAAAAVVATKEEVGLKRYALMLSILLLSFYNVHLYFSQ